MSNIVRCLKKNNSTIIIGVLSFLMFAIMVKNSAHLISLWLDELWEIGSMRTGQTISDFYKTSIKLYDSGSFLFNFIAYFWYRIVPYGERWLLLLPEFLMALSVFIIGITIRNMIDVRGAYFAVIMSSTLLYLGQYGNNFRGYPLYILVTALLFYTYIKRLKYRGNEKWRDILVYGALLSVLVYSHYVGVILCFVFFIFDIILLIAKKIRSRCFLSYILGGALFLPHAILIIKNIDISLSKSWVGAPNLTSIIILYKDLLGSEILLLYAFSLGCAFLIKNILAKKKIDFYDFPLFLGIFIPVIMIVITYIYSRYINPEGSIFESRYLICLMPMCIFVCSYAFTTLYNLLKLDTSYFKRGNEIIFILLLSLALYRIPNFYSALEKDPRYINRESYKAGTEWLLSQPDIWDNDTIIIQGDLYTAWKLPFNGWIEYYVTKQGKMIAPNIHGHNNINVDEKYNRIYFFYPWNRWLPNEINMLLDDFYNIVGENHDLKIRIYDLKK